MTDIEDFLGQVFETLLQGEGRALKHDEVFHAVDARAEIMCSFLVQEQTVFSAYPYVEQGAEWPLVVEFLDYGPSPLEATVCGQCHGLPVGVFDTLFFRNRVLYENSTDAQPFRVSALAYTVSEGDAQPAFVAQKEGARDEAAFVAQVSAARRISFWDFPMHVYDLRIPAPDATELTLPLYVPESAQTRPFDPGDWIAGRAWIFGQVLPQPDDKAAQSQEEAPQ